MNAYKTNPEQRLEVYRIAVQMADEGLGHAFADSVAILAGEYEGAYELMVLWKEEKDQSARDEIIADLQEEVDRLAEAHPTTFKAPKINFDELDRNIEQVMEYKKILKQWAEQWGGISKLARATGIPQPSLSRFFSSGSLPRNTTIHRIVNALQNSSNPTWNPPITVEQIRAAMEATRESASKGSEV